MMMIRARGMLFALAVVALAGCGARTAPAPMAPHGHMGMCMPGHRMATASPAQLARIDERMLAMQAAHAKMMLAKTPDERRALMAAHHEAMREGMAAMHAAMGAAPCMGPEMMQRHQGMMQMMMQMMAETPEAEAHVGITMGTGTDVAISSGHVALR